MLSVLIREGLDIESSTLTRRQICLKTNSALNPSRAGIRPGELRCAKHQPINVRVRIKTRPVWNDRSISLRSKTRLMRIVTSIFLYACESWNLKEELQRRVQAMEMRCYRNILRISYKDHVTNEEVRQAIGPHEDLLNIVKRRKLQWYRHVSGSSGLAKTILQGTVKEGKKTGQTEEEMGRQHQGMDRPGVRQVPEGSGEQRKMEETGCEIICGALRPSRIRDR